MSLAELGRFAEAAEYEAEAIRLAEPTQHAFTIGMAHFAASALHLAQGRLGAGALADRALDRGGSGRGTSSSIFPGGRLLRLGAGAARRGERGAEPAPGRRAAPRAAGGERMLAQARLVYRSLGRACLLLGRLDDARAPGRPRARILVRRQPGFAAHALHLLGDIATHPDRFDAERGEAHYRQALALAEPRGMRPLVAHCHLGLGKLYRRTGKREQAREHLTTATTMYREMDMTYWLEQAEAEMHE